MGDTETKKAWHCPDPTCRYIGTPSIHLLNFAPGRHEWSKAQVLDSLTPKKSYPRNWEGSEGP